MDLPRRVAIAGAIAVSTLGLAACGASAPGQGGGGGESPAASVAKSYTVKPGDTTPFALAEGSYRLGWTSTGCTSIELALTGDNGFESKKASRLPNSARIITSVPAGNYTIAQSDPACTQWQATIDKVG